MSRPSFADRAVPKTSTSGQYFSNRSPSERKAAISSSTKMALNMFFELLNPANLQKSCKPC
jgi:hypothetical protein